MKEKTLALFDFDGTIIRGDSFTQFLFFSQERKGKFLLGTVLFLPLYFLFFIGVLSEKAVKEIHLRFYCAGRDEELFTQQCQKYCNIVLPKYVKESAMNAIQWHKNEGHDVVIVSGTLDRIILPWCESQNIPLIATTTEIENHLITGNIIGENCTGAEKALRISKRYDLKTYTSIYAYGNSTGDREMLQLAHHPFHKNFH
jgi:HAD superfamily hydrolase (TIGR01490 family)